MAHENAGAGTVLAARLAAAVVSATALASARDRIELVVRQLGCVPVGGLCKSLQVLDRDVEALLPQQLDDGLGSLGLA